MFKHAAVLAAAVASSLAAAQGVKQIVSTRPTQAQAALSAPAQAGPEGASNGVPAHIAKAQDGHFWAQADVNGRPVKLLVDTGASAVALTRADAARLGLNVTALAYRSSVSTAGGETRAAPVMLEHLSVAGARVDHVQALVVRNGLKTSLLGMSYLGRLSRFEATRTALVLQP